MSTPEVERIIAALAHVESNDNPEAWGDSGQAVGRWQIHPARLQTLFGHYGVMVGTAETWDGLVRRLLVLLVSSNLDRSAAEIALYWHLGHWPTPAEVDSEYGRKFAAAYLAIRPP